MEISDALAFVRQHHHAVLATLKADGTPQLTPVTASVDADGHVVVSSRETAYKTKNLRRDPRAWLTVFTDGFYGEWVQLAGTVEVVSLPEAMEGLVDYYRSVSGEHPDWDEYREVMVSDQRCLLTINLEKAGPTRHG
ncbi:MAG: PPOX class F420-dependent oxidoreductase [Mycobacteriales bacterium]|nr:PPOX class F420-dependent oxidoreductase [Mycobacteriales bacterium]